MWKKTLIIALLIFCISMPTLAYDEDNENIDTEELLETSNETLNEPNVYSRAAVVLDRNTKTILYEKNMNEKRAMASTTKIMTAIIALENGNLAEVIEVSRKAANTGGSRLGLGAGDKITLNDLLYGLLLSSGNDAAVAIAENIGGSVEEFAILMNEKTKELNLKNTNFVTPHGLDAPEHYTTAYELALLADYAMGNKKFSEIVNTRSYSVKINNYTKNINNTNELLGYLEGVNGVKTGFTNDAGRCLVTSTNRNGFNIITVVLGADTKKIRTADSIRLIKYTYDTYEKINLKDIVEKEFLSYKMKNKIAVLKGIKEKLNYELNYNIYEYQPIRKNNIKDLKININTTKEVNAPIEYGTKVGEIKILLGEEEIMHMEIVSGENIRKKGIIDYMNEIAKFLLRR